jgi:hypothetical protein
MKLGACCFAPAAGAVSQWLPPSSALGKGKSSGGAQTILQERSRGRLCECVFEGLCCVLLLLMTPPSFFSKPWGG